MNLADLMLKENPLVAAPAVACKLTALLKQAPHNSEVVKVISYDPALTLRILKLCNTAYFSRGEPLDSLDRAIDRLGFEAILRLVWQITVGDRFRSKVTVYEMEAGSLWRHSVTTAIAAEELRQATDQVPEDSSTAFTAGLLHDFGKLIINHCLPESEKLKTYCLGEKMTVRAAERQLFDLDHAQLGGELLQQWNLPANLAQAVGGHHKTIKEERTPLAVLISLADTCAHLAGIAYGWGAMATRLSQEDLDFLHLNQKDVQNILLAIHKRSAEIEMYMTV